MAAVTFQKATKKKARLRLALMGPAGSGKTFSALRIARGMGAKVAVIDSERGSASKYAGLFDFDVVEVLTGHPQDYVDAIKAAGKAGFEVLIIDSLSHAWEGRDGSARELVDEAKARNKGNQWTAWRDVTPLHNALVDAILMSPCHVIATMRSKMKHVQETDEKGRNVIRKLGMEAIQRPGMEYEFDLVGDLDEAVLVVSKSRCPAFTKAVVKEPGEEMGLQLKAWLDDGVEEAKPAPLPSGPVPTAAPVAASSAGPVKSPLVVNFGPHKGKRIEKLSMEELQASITIGWEQAHSPAAAGAPWLAKLEAQLECLDAELVERRIEILRPTASAPVAAKLATQVNGSSGPQQMPLS